MAQRLVCAALTLVLAAAVSTAAATGAQSQDETVLYEAFRSWLTAQVPSVQKDPDEIVFERYRAKLRADGLAPAEVDRRIAVIRERGQRLEIERWNRILTAENPRFNTEPNAFLIEVTRGRQPGRALDVGMGQGRNAIYLAEQGWDVTGFDPAEQAVAVARKRATALGLRVSAFVQTDDEFHFGAGRWDLIVLSYVRVRPILDRVRASLKPGGLIVLEAYHRDATKDASIGGDVVWDTNEPLTAFAGFRILRYEDTEAPSDFGGRRTTRVVRLCAQKQ